MTLAITEFFVLIQDSAKDKFKRKVEALEQALDSYMANKGSIVQPVTQIAESPPGKKNLP